MRFLVRTEIHDKEYGHLHARMEAASFSRFVTSSGSLKRYHLPIGTYWTESYTSLSDVLAAAQRAALPVDPRAEIVVSGDGQILFSGCREIETPTPLMSFADELAKSTTPVPAATFYESFLWDRLAEGAAAAQPVPETVGSRFWEGILKGK
jgi:hypothetical protein